MFLWHGIFLALIDVPYLDAYNTLMFGESKVKSPTRAVSYNNQIAVRLVGGII